MRPWVRSTSSTVLALIALTALGGCAQSGKASIAPSMSPVGEVESPTLADPELIGPIADARAFATLLGQIAERDGDPFAIGSGDDVGDFGVADAWVAAGWPAEGFGPASPTSIDVHPLRGADTVDAFYLAYAVKDSQDRCFLGAVTPSPADYEMLFSLVIPGVSYRDCTADVAAQEFAVIVGTINGDQA